MVEHEQVQIAVRNGEMGEILYGYAHMEDRIEVPADWFPHWQPQSSPGWFLAPHFIDLVRWIMGGSNGRTVFARGHKEVLKKDEVADDKFMSGIGFYVKGVEGKIPGK